LAAGVRSNLEFEGYQVSVAATGREGLRLAKSRAHALIVLDLMLPDIDGFRVLRELREQGVETPVLILTAMGDETDKVRGFRFGADDYVTKPFGLMEFLARVQALLRRSRSGRETPATPQESAYRFGDISIAFSTRSVALHGAPVVLRPREYDLLVALVRRDGAIASREELLREVWGYDDSVVSRTVDTHMAELRRKLEADPSEPRWLLTVRKTGYRIATS
ncbi:MAG TPA: response regulator transcription factor, partial [Gemmatimonas sp.]|uniref:response regulator transcription factor n=1 Tax=Gemmatimonas sp. TaxID=1962908 RepID=UPI002EDAD52B